MASPSRPGVCSSQMVHAPGGGQVDPRRGIGDRTTSGQQGWARRRSPRHPGLRRDAGSRRRGRRCRRPARPTADRAPGTDAVRSPTGSRPPLSSATAPSCAGASRAASSPGRVAMRVPDILCRPREVYGAISRSAAADHGRSCAVGGEDGAGLVLGLEADHHHRAHGLEVGVQSPDRRSGRSAPRARRGTRPLLGSVRPGAEVDVVGAEGDPGERRVGVEVLGE